MADFKETIQEWQQYFGAHPRYQDLIDGLDHNEGGCGWIYEIDDPPVKHPDESVAIAIMNGKEMPVSEPHFHPKDVTEIYVVIRGMGKVIVGDEVHNVMPSSSVVIDNGLAHYTIPDGRLVMAVLNIPEFKKGDYITFDTSQSSDELGFNVEQYNSFTGQAV